MKQAIRKQIHILFSMGMISDLNRNTEWEKRLDTEYNVIITTEIMMKRHNLELFHTH